MAAAKLLASELANIARVIKDQFFTSFDADASIYSGFLGLSEIFCLR